MNIVEENISKEFRLKNTEKIKNYFIKDSVWCQIMIFKYSV